MLELSTIRGRGRDGGRAFSAVGTPGAKGAEVWKCPSVPGRPWDVKGLREGYSREPPRQHSLEL